MKNGSFATVLILCLSISCSNKFESMTRKSWTLKFHDYLVEDTIELQKLPFTLKRYNAKTLGFNRNGSFYYWYMNHPFYNKRTCWVCGTDELEIENNSSFYLIHGDTIILKFKASVLRTENCCEYDIAREFKIVKLNPKTIRLVKLRDLNITQKIR